MFEMLLSLVCTYLSVGQEIFFFQSLVLCVQNVMHIIQIKNASMKLSNFYERQTYGRREKIDN